MENTRTLIRMISKNNEGYVEYSPFVKRTLMYCIAKLYESGSPKRINQKASCVYEVFNALVWEEAYFIDNDEFARLEIPKDHFFMVYEKFEHYFGIKSGSIKDNLDVLEQIGWINREYERFYYDGFPLTRIWFQINHEKIKLDMAEYSIFESLYPDIANLKPEDCMAFGERYNYQKTKLDDEVKEDVEG